MNRFAVRLTRGAALVAAAAALTALPMLAQDTPPPPPPSQTQGPPQGGPGGPGRMNPERRLQMMKENLGLSDEQTRQVKAIMDENRGKMEGVRANQSLSREDMRAQMMNIARDEQSRVRAVLTADQQTKYDSMLARMRNRGGGPGGPGGPGGSEGQPPPPPPPPPQL